MVEFSWFLVLKQSSVCMYSSSEMPFNSVSRLCRDISDICKATIFSQIGKKTPAFARLSNVTGERGFTDVVRDIRGFAWKVIHTHAKNGGIMFPTAF